jgi:soluble lytic murein transglycosylase-like protein
LVAACCAALAALPSPARSDWTGDADATVQPSSGVEAPFAAPRPPEQAAAKPSRRTHADVAALMPRLDPALRRGVAKAIVAETELAGMDPLLVLALIHIESAFDPHAVSNAGAVGLMQLREATMRGEAARSRLASTNPLDPVASVQAGVRYLRRLIEAFGDTDVALMAYNAGPNRILQHMRRGEIPKRFHAYPRRIKLEMERLRASGEVPVS